MLPQEINSRLTRLRVEPIKEPQNSKGCLIGVRSFGEGVYVGGNMHGEGTVTVLLTRAQELTGNFASGGSCSSFGEYHGKRGGIGESVRNNSVMR